MLKINHNIGKHNLSRNYRRVIGQKLIKKGLKLERIFLIYSPERESCHNKNFFLKKYTKIVSGYSENCKKLGKAIYKFVSPSIHLVDNLKIAEMTKFLKIYTDQ